MDHYATRESTGAEAWPTETGEAVGKRVPSMPDHGLQPRYLLSVQGTLPERRRGSPLRDVPPEAAAQEPGLRGVERAVVRIAVEFPAYGQLRAANELRKEGIIGSPGGVRWVWLRHTPKTFKKRLKPLESKVHQEGIILTESRWPHWRKPSSRRRPTGRPSIPVT